MELFYWCGKPSEDPHSLALLVYMQMSKADVKRTPCSHPSQSPSGTLPCLQAGTEHFDTLESILQYLRKKGYNTDYDLTRQQSTECVAVAAMVQQKLHSVLLYSLWCEDDTYGTYTYRWYGRVVPFPRNFWYASRRRRLVESSLMALYGVSDLSLVKETVYSQARECLNLISERLDGQKYFFGDTPTSIDAIIYSYISLLQATPVCHNQLNTHIQACPPLTAFKALIQTTYADRLPNSGKEPSFADSTSLLQRMKRREWWWENHVNLASIVFAGTVMLSYAAARGILWHGKS